MFIINGKSYTKDDLKGKNIAIVDGSIIKVDSKEAVQKYGQRAKDGAVIFQGETKIIDNVLDTNYPLPPTPPTPPTFAMPKMDFPNLPKAPKSPSGTPLTNEKEWKKFEKKMAEFEEKMKTLEPKIEAYTKEMMNIEELMKPFEAEMKSYEEKMELYEIEMKKLLEKKEIEQGSKK
ncbi:hypothetical protein [Flavobacterium sp.]|uniref:hypothetical protein n=1 Tax=Flavobacterium sp. TaxID=239 RepID=UPI0026124BB2|nr:hypothetical protein [Flavobacterium sp.]